MPEGKSLILVVEDDLDVAEMLADYFSAQGYQVIKAHKGMDAVTLSHARHPDLVILDIRLPDIDGFQVAQQMRRNQRTKDISIIFLTEKRDRSDRLQGLGIGADDYITKPFDIHELRLRVRNALYRSTQGSLVNPITGLSEGALVDERLTACLEEGKWALLLVVIDHIAHFRETYGFVTADDVQRAVGLIIHNAVRDLSEPDSFVGHLDSADFILLTNAGNLPALIERIRSRLGHSLDYFYPLEDREKMDEMPKRLGIKYAQIFTDELQLRSLDSLKAELYRRLE